MTKNITTVNFDKDVLQSETPVLVDFWAAWCTPCKMLSPTVDLIAEERKDIKVCKVNIDQESALAMRYGVMSIPTLILFKDGEIVNKSIGLVSKEEIENML